MPNSIREPVVDTIDWVLTTLAAVVLVLRVNSKDQRRSPLRWDDHIMFASWILLLALTLACAFTVHDGAARQQQQQQQQQQHMADESADMPSFSNVADAVASTISIATAALSKTGFATMLVKDSKKGSWPHTVAWATIAVVNLTVAVTGLLLWLQCTPVRKTFTDLNAGYCWPGGVTIVAQIVNASISGTADIVLSLTAVYVVYSKTERQGYRVGAWFCAKLGIFAGIASFTKAALISTLASGHLPGNSVNIMIWGVVEPAVIIIAGSLPDLRNLIWKQPQPVVICREGDIHRYYKRERTVFGDDFDYVLQQYVEAGRKSFHSHSPRRASTESRLVVPTWWV